MGWWFPERAAKFIEQEKLPGEIFNTYDEGGYISWKLGPGRLDYIDGRDTLFAMERMQRARDVLQSQPDSALWQEEMSRCNINTVIFSRSGWHQHGRLRDLCNSSTWRPVYLDEVSAVFVRRTPQTESLIQRFPVSCRTDPLPAMNEVSTQSEQFVAGVNAGAVLAVLGRNDEAWRQSEKALALFPGSVNAHLAASRRALRLRQQTRSRRGIPERDRSQSDRVHMVGAGKFYIEQDRSSDAIAAIRKADRSASQSRVQLLIQLGNYAACGWSSR